MRKCRHLFGEGGKIQVKRAEEIEKVIRNISLYYPDLTSMLAALLKQQERK